MRDENSLLDYAWSVAAAGHGGRDGQGGRGRQGKARYSGSAFQRIIVSAWPWSRARTAGINHLAAC